MTPPAAAGAGPAARAPAVDDLWHLRVPSDPALSPDATRVAFVVTRADRETDSSRSALWWSATDGSAAQQLTSGPHDSAPQWSPDGRRIAFLRRGESGREQLWLLPAGGGEPYPLTHRALGAGRPVWSPDGTRIAFAAPVDPALPGEPGEAALDRRRHAPVVCDGLDGKADGAGVVGSVRLQLFVTDPSGGAPRQLTARPQGAGQPAWSPDGGRLAFAAPASDDPGLDPVSAAFLVELDGDDPQLRQLGPGTGQVATVLFVAEGDALLTTGRRDTAPGHASLLRSAIGDGSVSDLTAGLDRNVMPGGGAYPGAAPQLVDGGSSVLFCARDRGCTHLYRVPADGSAAPVEVLGGTTRSVSGLTVTAAGTAVVVVAGSRSAGDLVLLEGHRETELTRFGAEDLAGVEPVLPVERTFVAPDGAPVPALVLRRPDAPHPGPLLLDVHGGPHNAWTPVFDPAHLYQQELVAQGWTVLLVDPRGSDGYGEDHYRGVVGGWGTADVGDLLAAVDALVAEGVADPARLAITGYSYGGYTACWLPTRTDRFAAAVAGACASDLGSLAGTSDLGHYLAVREVGALPWADPARYAASSPMARAAEVRTPTLLLHGEDDERCPIGQSEQWFAQLRARGVPTRLVRYPGASHLFVLDGRPSHREHYARQLMAWLSRHVDAGPDAGPARTPEVRPHERVD